MEYDPSGECRSWISPEYDCGWQVVNKIPIQGFTYPEYYIPLIYDMNPWLWVQTVHCILIRCDCEWVPELVVWCLNIYCFICPIEILNFVRLNETADWEHIYGWNTSIRTSVFAKAVWYVKNGGKFHVILPIWADIRGQSCKRIRRSQSKTYWTLNGYKWTVPKPIWFKILSAHFWENVIWKWLKIGESAKVTRDGNLHARQRHKNNPGSFITWMQLDRMSNNLNKSKMHRKLARGRRNH